MLYRVLLENKVTHRVENNTRDYKPCRTEVYHPEVNWERTWTLAVTPGLSSEHLTFLWRMLHNLLPCQARLFRLKMPNVTSDICTLCNSNLTGDLNHCLLHCNFNDGAGQFLLVTLSNLVPNLQPNQVTLLNFDVSQENQLPAIYLISAVLSEVWICRKEKKPCHLNTIRATLEAGINIMRRSRYQAAAIKLSTILNFI